MRAARFFGLLAVVCALMVPASTQATQLAYWDFENVTSSGDISTSDAATSITSISAFVSQDGGGPAEQWAPPTGWVFLTRYFGTYHPYVELTVNSPITLRWVRFQHFHNHNPNHPSNPYYYIQLQIDLGSGFVDVGDQILASDATTGEVATVNVGNIALQPGTYHLRWDPRGLNGGTDTNFDYFAIDNLALEGTDGVAIPALSGSGSVLLASLIAGLALLFIARRFT